jgi:hypothetical protein
MDQVKLRHLYYSLLTMVVAAAIVIGYLTYHTFWGRLAH